MLQRRRFRRRFTESIAIGLADPSAHDDGDRLAKLVGDRMHLRHLDRGQTNDKAECFLFAHMEEIKSPLCIALRRTRPNSTAQRVNFKESLKNFARNYFVRLKPSS